jgi:S1-C subfamily serine protease
LLTSIGRTGTVFFITDDGYLISNYHVVKGAAKVRLLTGAGLIDATVVKVDAANDLALLKAGGRFAPLPIAASRTVKQGGTVASVVFPDIGLQRLCAQGAGARPPRGKSRRWRARRMTRVFSRSACRGG